MLRKAGADLAAVLAHVDLGIDCALERLFALLRIRSVSTDPARAADCRACADWHVSDLQSIGFGASARDTPGHPIVVGHDRTAPSGSALFYGHYDVHPVEPMVAWEHDPFSPFLDRRTDGTQLIRARGASDDKGQVMTFIEACRAWKEVAGRLPISVTVLIEGDAEAGSGNLSPFISDYASELRADIALICDNSMWDRTTPAIVAASLGRARHAMAAEWGDGHASANIASPTSVMHALQDRLGIEAILTGFARQDDRRHAANERFELERFRRGIRSWVRILQALAA